MHDEFLELLVDMADKEVRWQVHAVDQVMMQLSDLEADSMRGMETQRLVAMIRNRIGRLAAPSEKDEERREYLDSLRKNHRDDLENVLRPLLRIYLQKYRLHVRKAVQALIREEMRISG
ncbi:MAG: hypothetical protein WCV62_03215 [Candidatus Peribacteraceae bacterium]|jgi:uncharacterized protein YnzC (UPF0291/DUF896 family)